MKTRKVGLAAVLALCASQAMAIPVTAYDDSPDSETLITSPANAPASSRETLKFTTYLVDDSAYRPFSTTRYVRQSMVYSGPVDRGVVGVPEPGTGLLLTTGLLLLLCRRRSY